MQTSRRVATSTMAAWGARARLGLLLLGTGGCPSPLPPLPQDTDTDTGATDTEATTGDEVCGNGIVEAGETCDDEGESQTCDLDCTEVVCGDRTINAAAGEQCEQEDLGGQTCASQGFEGGTLACRDCALDTSGCQDSPAAPVLQLGLSPVKRFDFTWTPVEGADAYQLRESAAPGAPFVQLGEDLVSESISIERPLHLRHDARYVLRACNEVGCTDSEPVGVVGSLVEAMGYFKASNTATNDMFGHELVLSADGNTLAIAATLEDSGSTGIGGDQSDDSASDAGAVYVLVRDTTGQWSQQAYLKASNTDPMDYFGASLALSTDGDTLAVGAYLEDSAAIGIGGDEDDDSAGDTGAVYVFVRDAADHWSQQAYVKASNTDPYDVFGYDVALSADGDTLAVGAIGEDSSSTGTNGLQYENSALQSGAVYVFVRNAAEQWLQQAYVKASNTGEGDWFGEHVALSADGDTLAVGASYEAGGAVGVNGNDLDDSTFHAGAAYVLVRNTLGHWSQQAYVKASNTGTDDSFGSFVGLSADGDTLAVGARRERSSATGIDGDQTDDSKPDSGAVYVLVRDESSEWSQQAYIKASNPDAQDFFGWNGALSSDGDVLAVSAYLEASSATGVDGDQADDSIDYAGAVYVLVRDAAGDWSQRSYVKASNPGLGHEFGWSLALSGDAGILAVGAIGESGSATGIGGDPTDQSMLSAGAVYLY